MQTLNLINGKTIETTVSRDQFRRIVKRGYKFLKERSANSIVDRLFPDPSHLDFDIYVDGTCALTRGTGVKPSDLMGNGLFSHDHADFLAEIGVEDRSDLIQNWLSDRGFFHPNNSSNSLYYVALQDQWLRELVNDKTVDFTKEQAIETLNNMLNKHDYIEV